jgi:hypothetical protein
MRVHRGTLRWVVAPLVLVAWPAWSVEAAQYRGRQQELRVQPPRVEQSDVAIDGVLDEAVWQQAARLVDFSQYAPVDGRAATQETEVLVWYAPAAIYFGIRAAADSGSIRATLADRDRIDTDDRIEILLSTFNDGREAMVFGVNPLGVQMDGILVEGTASQGHGFSGLSTGRESADLSPDFVFQSRGRVTSSGYEVEIRIPFKSLRYPSLATQRWGLHVVRSVQSTGSEDSWVPARRDAASFLAQAAVLEGLTDLRRGLVLDLNPVVTGKSEGEPDGASWRYATGRPEVGFNVRWGVTPNLTLNGTANPDFSQVEADASQFVFDPRSALFFAEKRPFFLESSEQFSVPNNLIYTRRIVSPLAAVKVTGKVSGLSVGLLSAVDDEQTSASGRDRPVFNIARVQRDLGGQSRVGVVYTDRVDGPDSNRVAGADTRLVFGSIYSLQLQAAASRHEVAGTVTAAPLWQATFSRNGRRFAVRYSLRGVSGDFRTASGFISRAGIANANVTHQVNVYGAEGAWWQKFSSDVVLDGSWQYDDFVNGRPSQDRKLHLNENVTLRGGWQVGGSMLIETFGYDERFYRSYAIRTPAPSEPGGYTLVPYVGTPRLPNLDFVLQGSTPVRRGVGASGFVLWGRDENFFEWSSADIMFASLSVAWRPTEQLRTDGSWQFQSFDRRTDGSRVGDRTIPRVKVEYQLTRTVFLRTVVEYDVERQDTLRDDSRTNLPVYILDPATGQYGPALGFTRRHLRADLLFSYQPSPGTVIFAGYSSLRASPTAAGPGLRRETDGFFLKVSYLFRL